MKKLTIKRSKWIRTRPGKDLDDSRSAEDDNKCMCFGSFVALGYHEPTEVPYKYGAAPRYLRSNMSEHATIVMINDYPNSYGIKTSREQEGILIRAAKKLGYAVKFVGRGRPKSLEIEG